MAKETKISKLKVKRKRWFPILAPTFLGQGEIGESYLSEPRLAINRVLKINLRDLTKNIRDQNIYVSLRIKGTSGNNLETEIAGYAYMPFFVKRLVRGGTSKIDDSFVLKTKDDKTTRLKPLVITVFLVKKSAKTAIKKKLRELLKEEVAKLTFDGLINDLLKYKLQVEFKKELNKICPVREMIMRMVSLEEKKVKVKKEREKEEEKAEGKAEEEKKPEETVGGGTAAKEEK